MAEQMVPMVDLKGQYQRIKGEIRQEIDKVLDECKFINGPQVSEFAHDLSRYLDVDYVIPCANGTDALQIALMALELKQGDEILVPSWTYVATVEVIALLGLKPIFIEVYPDTFNIDIEDLENKVTERSRAIIPVHLYGQCADMEGIMSVAKENNLMVIEDTAQALGARYTFSDGSIRRAGTIGQIGTTSFFPSKNLGCYGDGGALMTNDSELAARLRMIANHGQSRKYVNDSIGVNSRLDTLQAAVLKVKLRYLDEYAAARNEVANWYDQAFEGQSAIQEPVRSKFSDHVFHQYTVKLGDGIDRDKLKEDLQKNGIPSMIYYPIPNHLQKAYTFYGFKAGDMPETEKLSKQVLSLPIHTEMSGSENNFIIQKILKCL